MLDAPADIPESQVEKKPNTLSTVVPAQEAQDAICKAFPCQGDLRSAISGQRMGFRDFAQIGFARRMAR